jgi:hypothetical protein
MNPLIQSRIKRVACSAIVVLLSACGGGGSTDRPATLTANVTPSPAPAAPAAPMPAPAGSPSAAYDLAAPGVSVATACPPEVCTGTQYQELTARAGPLDVTDARPLSDTEQLVNTGGEAPYPDLRMLPTRIMAFEPVVYGDVSSVAVTSVH